MLKISILESLTPKFKHQKSICLNTLIINYKNILCFELHSKTFYKINFRGFESRLDLFKFWYLYAPQWLRSIDLDCWHLFLMWKSFVTLSNIFSPVALDLNPYPNINQTILNRISLKMQVLTVVSNGWEMTLETHTLYQ